MTADLQAQVVEALADILMSRELHEARVYGRDYALAEARAILDSGLVVPAALVSAHVAQVREGLAEEELRRASRALLRSRVAAATGKHSPGSEAAAWDRFALALDAAEDAARIVRPSVGPREQGEVTPASDGGGFCFNGCCCPPPTGTSREDGGDG